MALSQRSGCRMNFGGGEELVQTMAHITRHCHEGYRHEDERLMAKGDEAGQRVDDEYFLLRVFWELWHLGVEMRLLSLEQKSGRLSDNKAEWVRT